jgi:hypothetical protein
MQTAAALGLATAAVVGGAVGAGVTARTYTRYKMTSTGHLLRRRVHRAPHRAPEAIDEYPLAVRPLLTNRMYNATQNVLILPDIVGGLYMPGNDAYEPGRPIPAENQPQHIEASRAKILNPSPDHNQDQTPASDQMVPVNMELVAHLQTEAFLRPRTLATALVLKNKAKAFLKDYDNTDTYKKYQTMHAVPLAFDVSEPELLALAHMTSPAVATRVNYINAVLAGQQVELSDFSNAPCADYMSMGYDILRKVLAPLNVGEDRHSALRPE